MGVWEWGCGDRDEGIGIQACRNGDAGMQGCRVKGWMRDENAGI